MVNVHNTYIRGEGKRGEGEGEKMHISYCRTEG